MSYAIAYPENIWIQLDDGTRLEAAPVKFVEFTTAIVNLWQRRLLTRKSAMAAQRSRFGPSDSTDSFVGRTLTTFHIFFPVEAQEDVVALYVDTSGVHV